MYQDDYKFRFVRVSLPTALASFALTLSGCASSSRYMGIDLAAAPVTASPAEAPPSLTERLERAGCLPPAAERREGRTEISGQAECRAILETYIMRLRGGPSLVQTTQYGNMSIKQLAQSAQSGSKQAQLELGKRFEWACKSPLSVEHDVPCDLMKAKKLYTQAASDSGGTMWVYSPAVGNGTSGRVIPVSAGPKQFGLAEAKKRLANINE